MKSSMQAATRDSGSTGALAEGGPFSARRYRSGSTRGSTQPGHIALIFVKAHPAEVYLDASPLWYRVYHRWGKDAIGGRKLSISSMLRVIDNPHDMVTGVLRSPRGHD